MSAQVVSEMLLRTLVCPACHGAVTAGPEGVAQAWLHCSGCGRYYPVQDGIPVMLQDRASQNPPAREQT